MDILLIDWHSIELIQLRQSRPVERNIGGHRIAQLSDHGHLGDLLAEVKERAAFVQVQPVLGVCATLVAVENCFQCL